MDTLISRAKEWAAKSEHRLLFLALTVLISGLYISYVSMRTLPLSEGWYSVYAKSINSGLAPYKDFELLFTPLYVYIVALITKIFGYGIFVLRITGAMVFVLLAVLMFYIFDRLFTPFVAMVVSTASIMFLQSEVVFIAYDYIRWFDLFTYVAVLTLLLWWFAFQAPGRNRRAYVLVAVSGLFSGLGFLTRQNSGLIYIAYTVLALLVIALLLERGKAVIGMLGVYVATAALPVVAQLSYLSASGSLAQYTAMTTTNALAAKGGLVTVLFSWLGRAVPVIAANRWEIIAIIACTALAYGAYRMAPDRQTVAQRRLFDATAGLGFAALTILGMYALFRRIRLSRLLATFFSNPNSPYVMYTVVLVLLVAVAVVIVRRRYTGASDRIDWLVGYALLLGAIIAIGYGAGTSAGLSQGETALAVGAVAALLFKLLQGRYRNVPTIALILAMMLSTWTCMSLKNVTPYSWWGLSQGPIGTLNKTMNIPQLEHIRVSVRDKQMFEGIHSALTTNLHASDQLFAFPHIPIFYLTENRTPFTSSYVQWFDVVSDATIQKDIEKVRSTRPEAIVLCEVPESVMAWHEAAFRGSRKSGLREMQSFLRNYTATHGYHPVARYGVPDGYVITVYVRSAFATSGPKGYVPLGHDTKVLSQYVQFSENRISKLYVKVKSYDRSTAATLEATLVDRISGASVMATSTSVVGLKTGDYVVLSFPEMTVSTSEPYRLDLSLSQPTDTNEVAIYRTDYGTASRGIYALKDGERTPFNLCVALRNR